MDQKVKSFLENKNKSATKAYRRAFNLFRKYTKEEHNEEIGGEKLIKIVAEDRRKKIEDRERPEANLLKGFFDWLSEEAPKARGSGKGYSPKTCHTYLAGINDFLNHNDLPVNKKRLNLEKPTRKKNNRKLNIRSQEVKKLVNHAKTTRDKAVILCLWQSGMSINDLLQLDIGDIMVEDEVRGSLETPPLLIKLVREKAGVEYRTFFGQDACEMLQIYLEERKRTIGEFERSDPLFLQQRKNGEEEYQRLTPGAVDNMFRRLALKSGIVSEEKMEEADFNPARPHALRAGFADVLKKEDVNDTIIEGLMGHSVSYDSAYSNLTDQELREIYQEHEDSLSIEKVSIPREEEIEEIVKKHFGKMGAERIMPELNEKVKQQDERIRELEEEVESLKNRTSTVLNEIVNEEEAEKILDAAKKIVSAEEE